MVYISMVPGAGGSNRKCAVTDRASAVSEAWAAGIFRSKSAPKVQTQAVTLCVILKIHFKSTALQA